MWITAISTRGNALTVNLDVLSCFEDETVDGNQVTTFHEPGPDARYSYRVRGHLSDKINDGIDFGATRLDLRPPDGAEIPF